MKKVFSDILKILGFLLLLTYLGLTVPYWGMEGSGFFLVINGLLLYFFYFQIKAYKEDGKNLKEIAITSMLLLVLIPSNFYGLSNAIEERNERLRSLREAEYLASLPSNTTTTTSSTIPITLTWDDMYETCTNRRNLKRDSYSGLTFFFDNRPLYQYIEENPREVSEFCNNNFSYDPISPDMYIYSAKWVDEALNLNRWIKLTKDMCEKYPSECEGYGSEYNWDFDFLTLQAAFEIKNFDDTYNCFIEESYPESTSLLETSRYIRFTDASEDYNYDDEGKRINKPIGNQYIRSSVIFPKPYDEPIYITDGDYEYEEYAFSPELDYSLPSLTQEPLYLWNCIYKGGDAEGPWLIKGFGPPFIRGSVDVSSANISAEGNWVMWSVIEPGPDSVVVELEITKFYWFNEVPTTIEFCNNYEISEDYLSAETERFDLFPELINLEFVTSHYCYMRTEFTSPTYYP